MTSATARANPNIAFIKYWGNRDDALRLPSNGSISMNLDGLHTTTTVTFSTDLPADSLALNGRPVLGPGLERVTAFLDIVRQMAGQHYPARVVSENNFPTGAGVASSASAFAALSLAAPAALGMHLTEAEHSRLARRGSGSAARSVPGGFVEWQPGESDRDSFACSLAPAEHWPLVDCIAVVSGGQKKVGSTAGHALAGSSPLQAARVASAPGRLDACRHALLQRDFDALAAVVELDSNLMHAVMMTSTPPLFYWQPLSLALMKSVPAWRRSGLPVCYTLDAGPNVHLLCEPHIANEIEQRISSFSGISSVLVARAGGPARLMAD